MKRLLLLSIVVFTVCDLSIVSGLTLEEKNNFPSNKGNDEYYSGRYLICLDAAKESIEDIKKCAEKEYLLWDAVLSKYWREFYKNPGAIKEDASISERWGTAHGVWMIYRDKQCAVSSISMSDEAMKVWQFDCLKNLTIRRLNDLRSPYWPAPSLHYFLLD